MVHAPFPTIPATIPELFATTVARRGNQPALGTIADGQLSWRTWDEIAADVRRCAVAFQQHDILKGDRVAQWTANSYEWIIIDLALLELGAVHVPLHISLSAGQVGELLELAEVKLLVVHGEPVGVEFFVVAERLPALTHRELLQASDSPMVVQRTSCSSAPSTLATLLFTSGTTGQPRGVMLSHENLVANALATAEAVGAKSDETRLCFLPLSHLYARTCDLYSWVIRGTRLVLAESRETIVRDCQLASPQVLNGVPYFYQKIAQQLQEAQPGALQKLLGGKIRRCFCGGAAMAPEVETFFERQGLPILSGYGLTEASPVVSATSLDNYRAGSVGCPLPNVEVKISSVGEILVRGPNVMLGYWKDPEATGTAIVDAWLHTGDLGRIDASGHLHIVGRQKELIVLSTGKNIAPSRIEQRLSGSPFVEHVCVVGDSRKCLGALIVPNPDALRQAIRHRRLWVGSRRRAVRHPQIRKLFQQEIQRLLVDLSAEEQIGPFTILPRNFSIEQGELTAKLSLRRSTITANFSKVIEKMYAR